MDTTIIDQMIKFFKNSFNFELVVKKFGKISTNTAIKKIAGIILSNSIFLIFPKILRFLKKTF